MKGYLIDLHSLLIKAKFHKIKIYQNCINLYFFFFFFNKIGLFVINNTVVNLKKKKNK
jgi:hypothetical protein